LCSPLNCKSCQHLQCHKRQYYAALILKERNDDKKKVKLSLCLTNYAPRHEDIWRVDVYIHIFLTSALVGSEWSISHPCRFTPEERAPGTRWIGGWVGPTAGLDDVEKRKFLTLPGFELRPLGRPAFSQSLYRLRYPGSWNDDRPIVIRLRSKFSGSFHNAVT
jgi:hypothetical protein